VVFWSVSCKLVGEGNLFGYWLLLICNRDKAILFQIGNILIPVFFWIWFRRFSTFHSWFLVILECFLPVQSDSCCFVTGSACFLTGSVCFKTGSVCFNTGSVLSRSGSMCFSPSLVVFFLVQHILWLVLAISWLVQRVFSQFNCFSARSSTFFIGSSGLSLDWAKWRTHRVCCSRG